MGNSYTPPYIVVVDGKESEAMEWRASDYGKPTPTNLEKWVITYGKSFEPGQCNAHISEALGYIPYPRRAYIRRNVRTNEPQGAALAAWAAPMFFVW